MSKDFNYIPFPETYDRRKLNSLYREIPLKDTESRLLRKYFNAASNLYGIIPLGKLYEIISSQSRHPVSEDVFRAFAEIAKHVMTFAGVYQAFQNNTRMRCNRGHTPGELHAMRTPEDRVPKSISLGPNIRRAIAEGSMDAEAMRQQIMAMELPGEALRASLLKELTDAMKPGPVKRVKIGRNEPCPCGSGKKYKKCCGR